MFERKRLIEACKSLRVNESELFTYRPIYKRE